jgi:hypothetical protein
MSFEDALFITIGAFLAAIAIKGPMSGINLYFILVPVLVTGFIMYGYSKFKNR